MASPISSQETRATLIALPMKVATATGSPAVSGLRKRISSITTGNSTSSTRAVCFQAGGVAPPSSGNQPAKGAARRRLVQVATAGSAWRSSARRSGEASQASSSAGVAKRTSAVQ